jgi:acetoin utilization protein AcuB
MNPRSKISDYMSPFPQTIGEDITLTKALEMLRERRIRHLPVQYGGRLVGVLSDRDIKLALTVYPAAKDIKVGDIMTEEPYTVSPETSMQEVLHQMAIHKYGCVIVEDENSRAIGILTTTDAVRILSEVFSDNESANNQQYGFKSEKRINLK